MANKPVVIIGAGCAGLAAGYELQKRGVDFVLLEGSDVVGGRTGLIHFNPDRPEDYCNWGAVFAEPNSVNTMGYLDELGLDIYCPMDRKVYGYWNNNEVHYIVDDGNLFQAMMGLRGLPPAIIPQGLKFAKNLAKAQKKIDGMNFDGLIEEAGMNTWDWCVENGGFEIADKVVAPMIQGMTAGSVRDTSIAHPIALLGGMEGMGQLRGGHTAINEALYERIADSVRLNTRVEKVVIEDDVVKGVVLADGETIDADYVMICTDTIDALKLIPDAPATITDALKTAIYSKCWHFVFTFEKRFVPDDFVLLMLPPSTNPKFCSVFEENIHDVVAAPGTSVMHLFVADWAAEEWNAMPDDEARIEAARKEAAQYFPEFENDGECVCCKYIPYAVNLEPVGQFPAIHGMFNVLYDTVKGLRMAGEFAYLVACTEGAYLTAKREAAQIADELGA